VQYSSSSAFVGEAAFEIVMLPFGVGKVPELAVVVIFAIALG